ncbi:hypothetical protein E8E11_009849 [Didymella keratinophila]|nr:hypothetical protein E8E11_009849 [Didymella keratinophila]
MTDSQTPSEMDFWHKHVEALETCNICMDPFAGERVALRFTAKDACSHVFGHPCLRKWTETANQNANQCPICRRVLWKSDDPFHVTNMADNVHGEFDAGEAALENLEEALENLEEALEDFQFDQDEEALQICTMCNWALPRDRTDRGLEVVDGDDSRDADSLSSSSTLSLIDEEEDWGAEQADDDHLSDETIDRMLNSIVNAQVSDDDNDEQLSDDMMARMLSSSLDAQDSDDDDDEPDTVTTAPMRTVSLKTLDRNIIDSLLDDLYNLSASRYLMPLDAGMSHMRERMEQCIDVALLEAGFTEPCQIAPGFLDDMLMHFQSMVVYHRAYTVSETYLQWWKHAMLAYIEREEPGPLEPRAPAARTPEMGSAGCRFTAGSGGSFKGFSPVPCFTSLSGTSNFGRKSGFSSNGTSGTTYEPGSWIP